MTCGKYRQLIMCLAALGLAPVASAEVLYDTFGPDDGYLHDRFWPCGKTGTQGPPNDPMATLTWNGAQFELEEGTYTNITVTMPLTTHEEVFDPPLLFSVNIYANDGEPGYVFPEPGECPCDENGPGTLLASVDAVVSDLPVFMTQDDHPAKLTTFEFESLTLTGDAKYWVTVQTPLNDDWTYHPDVSGAEKIHWWSNELDVTDNKAQKTHNEAGQWQDYWIVQGPGTFGGPPVDNQGAMRVEGTLEESPCQADIAGNDGTVNVNDLLTLLSNWGTSGTGADLAVPNDVVNVADLLELLGEWGRCK